MGDASVYRIRVRGELDPEWSSWFEGLAIEADRDATTALTGLLPDQAALHGVLARARDLGLEIVTVEQLDEPATSGDGRRPGHAPRNR